MFSYIAQLITPSAEVQRFLKHIVYKLFPGPGNWMHINLARSLKHLGFPCQLLDPVLVSIAAMRRYYERTGLNIGEMASEMFLHLKHYELQPYVNPKFLEWHGNAFCTNLVRNLHKSDPSCIGMSKEGFSLIKRNLIQKTLSKALHDKAYSKTAAIDKLRRRLKRWDVLMNERRTTDRALRNLDTIRRRCKPAVQAAMLRTLLNGWVTKRRMRSLSVASDDYGICVFGCGRGCDSIEHYAHCTILLDFFSEAMAVKQQAGITHFLALGRRLSVEQLVVHTRCLYAAYLSHCILRHTSQSLLDNNGVQSLLRASLARAGVGRRKA